MVDYGFILSLKLGFEISLLHNSLGTTITYIGLLAVTEHYVQENSRKLRIFVFSRCKLGFFVDVD